jgi:hypothetical protein
MARSSDRGYQEGAHARKTRPILTLVIIAFMAMAALGLMRALSDWTTISREPLEAISGLARMNGGGSGGELELLVVHDTRLPNEVRLASLILGSTPQYTPIAWPEGYALPIDLEAVSPIPGRTGLFVVATSGGTATLLAIADGRAQNHGAFTLPGRPGLPNFEGVSVQQLGDVLVVAWGHRGAGEEAGRLFWGRLDLETPAVTGVQAADLRVPFPTESNPNTRHISDLRIARDGRVWLSATNDPGNAGPFPSAIYDVGRFSVSSGVVRFEQHASLSPVSTYARKIEAIELTDDESQLVLGTDDENNGAAVAMLEIGGR